MDIPVNEWIPKNDGSLVKCIDPSKDSYFLLSILNFKMVSIRISFLLKQVFRSEEASEENHPTLGSSSRPNKPNGLDWVIHGFRIPYHPEQSFGRLGLPGCILMNERKNLPSWTFQFGCQMVAKGVSIINHPLGFIWHPLEGAGLNLPTKKNPFQNNTPRAIGLGKFIPHENCELTKWTFRNFPQTFGFKRTYRGYNYPFPKLPWTSW